MAERSESGNLNRRFTAFSVLGRPSNLDFGAFGGGQAA